MPKNDHLKKWRIKTREITRSKGLAPASVIDSIPWDMYYVIGCTPEEAVDEAIREGHYGKTV